MARRRPVRPGDVLSGPESIFLIFLENFGLKFWSEIFLENFSRKFWTPFLAKNFCSRNKLLLIPNGLKSMREKLSYCKENTKENLKYKKSNQGISFY